MAICQHLAHLRKLLTRATHDAKTAATHTVDNVMSVSRPLNRTMAVVMQNNLEWHACIEKRP
eukprot:CAMPEP_0115836958 /NCGR_PEP_ID=MMETSP0287-20121206/4973_1 /TAXON_ID=412157 /ORGANISM="Chrysochromulina rotalis, Strain UIO044" /LENGTH=61 /DNA_ID=CAMNT_0003290453 /DNA_START=1115 /DNA_END=1300 /DNA_ORIENTATION=+